MSRTRAVTTGATARKTVTTSGIVPALIAVGPGSEEMFCFVAPGSASAPVFSWRVHEEPGVFNSDCQALPAGARVGDKKQKTLDVMIMVLVVLVGL